MAWLALPCIGMPCPSCGLDQAIQAMRCLRFGMPSPCLCSHSTHSDLVTLPEAYGGVKMSTKFFETCLALPCLARSMPAAFAQLADSLRTACRQPCLACALLKMSTKIFGTCPAMGCAQHAGSLWAACAQHVGSVRRQNFSSVCRQHAGSVRATCWVCRQ